MRTIVLTGVTGLIGRVLLKHFAAAGDVVVGIGRSYEALDKLKGELGDASKQFHYLISDLSSDNSCDQIKKGYGLQLTVSMGLPPDFFQVPQLFGLSLNNAKEKLKNSKLKLGKVSYQQNEDLVPYTVLDQSIIPGTVLEQSAKINLVVSILDLQDIFDTLQNDK